MKMKLGAKSVELEADALNDRCPLRGGVLERLQRLLRRSADRDDVERRSPVLDLLQLKSPDDLAVHARNNLGADPLGREEHKVERRIEAGRASFRGGRHVGR